MQKQILTLGSLTATLLVGYRLMVICYRSLNSVVDGIIVRKLSSCLDSSPIAIGVLALDSGGNSYWLLVNGTEA